MKLGVIGARQGDFLLNRIVKVLKERTQVEVIRIDTRNKLLHSDLDVVLVEGYGGILFKIKLMKEVLAINANKPRRVLCTHEVPYRISLNDTIITQNFDVFVGAAGDRKPSDPPHFTRVRYPHWAQNIGHFGELRAFKVLAPSLEGRQRAATFIAGNPNAGKRMRLVNNIRQTAKLPVLCAGRVGRNTTPVPPGAHAKREYIARHVFNVCPENSSHPGYVTEKILEACVMGCIPIYWGHPRLEPGIINPKRVIFCQSETTLGATNAAMIRRLLTDEAALKEFWEQPIFLETAHEKIAEWDRKLDAAICEKIHTI